MKIVEITQGTPEWHKFRQEGIGSSEIYGLMTSEPFSPFWQNLKTEKLTGKQSDFQNQAMKEGKEGEIQAFRYLLNIDPSLSPQCAIHDELSYVRCSFDAIGVGGIHEIKTPQAKNLEEALFGRMPEKWIAQLRWQMMVADKSEGLLEIWDGQVPHTFAFDRDLSWDEKALRVAKQFWDWVIDGIVPQERYIECHDEDKSVFLSLYKQACEKIKQLEIDRDNYKNKLLEGMDINFILDGAKIYQTANTSYDYKKMVADFNISLDSYKKQSKPFWKIAL